MAIDAKPASNAPSTPPSVPGTDVPVGTIKEFMAKWDAQLRRVLADWQRALPAEAATTWPRGAAYVRESYGASLVGDSPDTQLRNVLELMARRQFYVPDNGLFFEVQSATQVATRGVFKRLYEFALAGQAKAIGVFISERLFRNVVDSGTIKTEFRKKGIEVFYLGKYEGDERHPAAWQLDTMQDVANELHARNTSYQVGMNFENRSRSGRPVGKLPEVYESHRGPSFMGRRGSVISWALAEPLASIMIEGKDRFLAGANYRDLAAWAATTELAGKTPAGRQMDRRWWWWTLRNVRFAGYQTITEYQGFKPGIFSPKRPRITTSSPLVPAVTPALWTLEDYHRILKLSESRRGKPVERRTYRDYLLSSIAYDAGCGHLMHIRRGLDEAVWMRCAEAWQDRCKSAGHRADLAAAELDELLSNLDFDDPALLRQIEEELRVLERDEGVERAAFVPDPAIAALKTALGSLGEYANPKVRAALHAQVVDLERADFERREARIGPIVSFRDAVDGLQHWNEVWPTADTALKNRLLREAGVRVELGQLPGKGSKRPFHLLSVSAESPAFELALAAAVASRIERSGTPQVCKQTNLPITIEIEEELRAAGRRLGPLDDEGRLAIECGRDREARYPKEFANSEWLTIQEFAVRTGVRTSRVVDWLRAGLITHTRGGGSGAGRWRLIHVSELPLAVSRQDAPLTNRPNGIGGPMADELIEWLRGRLGLLTGSARSLAAAAGLSEWSFLAARKGTTRPTLKTCSQLLALVERSGRDAETARYRHLIDVSLEAWGEMPVVDECRAKAA